MFGGWAELESEVADMWTAATIGYNNMRYMCVIYMVTAHHLME